MVWYVARTTPSAQRPQRMNPRESSVERALSDNGFICYMPAEFKAIRARRHTGRHELRRFPLLVGYVFVHGVTDWPRLCETDGITGYVAINGKPLTVSVLDMLVLRTYEANSEASADAEMRKLSSGETAAEKKARKKAAQAARRKLQEGKQVKLLWGRKVGREATVLGWEDEERVKAIVREFAQAETIVVPYEYLRTIESEAA